MATKLITPSPPPPVKAGHLSSTQLPETTTSTLVKQEPRELAISNNPPTKSSDNHQFIQQSLQPHFIDSVSKIRDHTAALSAFLRRYDELQEHLDFIRTSIDAKLPSSVAAEISIGALPPQPIAVVPFTKSLPSNIAETTIGASSPQPMEVVPSSKSKHPVATKKPMETVPPSKPKSPVAQETPTAGVPFKPKSPVVLETPMAVVPSCKLKSPAALETPMVESAKSGNEIDNNQSSESEVELLCKRMCGRMLKKYIMTRLSDVAKLREEVPSALKLARNPGKLVLDCFGRFYLQGIRAYDKDSQMVPGRQASVLILEFFLLAGCNYDEIEDSVKTEAESAAVDWSKRLMTEGGLAKACEVDARGLLLLIGCFGIPRAFENRDIKDLIRAGKAREISDALCRSHVLVPRITGMVEDMIKKKMQVGAVDIAYTFGLETRFPPRTILTTFLQESKDTWTEAKKEAQGSSEALNKANKKQLSDFKRVRKFLEDHKVDPLMVLPGWNINEKITTLERKIADLDKKMEKQGTLKRKADEPESSKKLKNEDVKRARYGGWGSERQKAAAYADGNGSFDGLIPRNGAGAGMSLGTGDILPGRSYAGVQGGVLVDRAGQVIDYRGHPYGWHGDVSFRERLIGQSFDEPAALGLNGMYRPAPSADGFIGLPGVSKRSSASDLYQFADAIPDSEPYGGSRTGRAAPPALPSRYSSYLY